MGSSLLQWESDPLFSAAEVVQDSADRMESIFRLLFHEQSLFQGDHSDPKLLTSIGYHRRDLATILETAKWQLEDFEKAVSSSARMDQSHSREDAISRHKQFIRAIREQINNVEKSLEEMAMGNPMKTSEWGNLNEKDRDGLALFLSGGNHNEHNHRYDLDDSDILKRFLDPATASCSTDAGIVGNECGEIEEVNMNGVAYSSHYYDSMKDNNLRKVGSHCSIKLGLDAVDYFQESSRNRNAEDGSWDLEASEGKPKSFFHENKLRGTSSRMNLFGFFNNLWTAYGRRFPSNYTKRLKDGEEGHSPSYIDASRAAEGQRIGPSSAPVDLVLRVLHGFLVKVMQLRRMLGAGNARFDRFSYLAKVNRRSIQMILTIVFAFTLLGILIFHVA
ncbi:uncharacterized protein LOC111311713 isoform X2 [Durio zibethinus]|uniref:Uncharacterized protein LOC111311713 isoform X2 n=1 Tax=Durio zibethinus TaxID=66656 RepID=A0A6P6AQG8_DURZI|nr:uncharacterized protein LOC111311713 isoform X2 [Durio zibethinus]